MSSSNQYDNGFAEPLQSFLNSKNDFEVIYSTASEISPQKSLISNTTNRVCVLDSSFNPPHLGHYALAKESLSYHYKNQSLANNEEERTLLLLLSVKNADKATLVPASLEDRIHMMYLMARYLHRTLNVSVSIGLTNHAKFVDKSVSILNYIQKAFPSIDIHDLRLTFLVGFDTLIRIFNPTYYLPDKLSESLSHFMKVTDLFCLTRNDVENTYQQQNNYVKDISKGRYESIPNDWSSNIHLLDHSEEPDGSVGRISSSAIRKEISQHNWYNHVIPEIKEYIITKGLYTS